MNGLKILLLFALILSLTIVLVQFLPRVAQAPDVIIEMTSEQFKFTPDEITVKYLQQVTLRITSLDVTHGFQLEEFDLYNVVVPSGESVDVSFVAHQRGTFYFICTVICGTGHADHLGTLIVE